MEHRWRIRKPVDLRIRIYQAGLPVAVGVGSNLNPEGMFVQIQDSNLKRGSHLEIEVLTANPMLRNRRMPGIVVHGSPKGLGVMFSRVDQRVYAKVQEIGLRNVVAS